MSNFKPFINLKQASASQTNTKTAIYKVIEEFLCRMYSLKTKDEVNKSFELFYKFRQLGVWKRSSAESFHIRNIVGLVAKRHSQSFSYVCVKKI